MRLALVTGANRGLGLETCRQLLDRDLRVVMTARDEAALRKAAHAIDPDSGKLMTVRLDVTDPSSILAAQRAIVRQMGEVDIVVNNAAILVRENDDVLETPARAFRDTFDTNVFGAMEVCRVFAPSMGERGYGRIVNVSSGVSQLSRMSTYAPAYSISKTALNAFTRVLAETYRGRGVLVNAVDPGWVRTDMGGRSAPRSVEQGADTITWLATLPDDGPTGGFFRDRRKIDW